MPALKVKGKKLHTYYNTDILKSEVSTLYRIDGDVSDANTIVYKDGSAIFKIFFSRS